MASETGESPKLIWPWDWYSIGVSFTLTCLDPSMLLEESVFASGRSTVSDWRWSEASRLFHPSERKYRHTISCEACPTWWLWKKSQWICSRSSKAKETISSPVGLNLCFTRRGETSKILSICFHELSSVIGEELRMWLCESDIIPDICFDEDRLSEWSYRRSPCTSPSDSTLLWTSDIGTLRAKIIPQIWLRLEIILRKSRRCSSATNPK